MSSAREKLNWYQTDANVVLTILVKDVQADQLKLDLQSTAVSVEIQQPAPANVNYKLSLQLAHPVVVEQSSHKITPSKVEIKLRKTEGIRWADLEGDGKAQEVKQQMAQCNEAEKIRHYPTSSKQSHNWDKLAADMEKEEKNEKLEGDAALNKLFQQIYADATDDTKRAMMKSFTESGGTVLSTNWNEVGKGKVDVKPPDGMEYKQWQQ